MCIHSKLTHVAVVNAVGVAAIIAILYSVGHATVIIAAVSFVAIANPTINILSWFHCHCRSKRI